MIEMVQAEWAKRENAYMAIHPVTKQCVPLLQQGMGGGTHFVPVRFITPKRETLLQRVAMLERQHACLFDAGLYDEDLEVYGQLLELKARLGLLKHPDPEIEAEAVACRRERDRENERIRGEDVQGSG